VRVDKEPKDTVYLLNTSIADEMQLARLLQKGLSDAKVASLITYKTKSQKLQPSGSSSLSTDSRIRYVATTAQPPAGSTETATPLPEQIATAEPTKTVTRFLLELSGAEEQDSEGRPKNLAKRNYSQMREDVLAAAKNAGIELNPSLLSLAPSPCLPSWREDSADSFDKWEIGLPMAADQADKLMATLTNSIEETPLWLSLSQIRGRVAKEMQQRALAALLMSFVFIVIYVWFRFQRVSYGLAGVVALVHDVLITMGALALSHWFAKPLGLLGVDDFKIGLTEIAAFLAIIGYSLNDSIVIFDRVREIRGRSVRITEEMLNQAINQTLSRTILTSGLTLIAVLVLYILGGEGIHAFAFSLLVGIVVGTYSSIFIASPILLWLNKREVAAAARG
jgi:SecD/SecF fusion protein